MRSSGRIAIDFNLYISCSGSRVSKQSRTVSSNCCKKTPWFSKEDSFKGFGIPNSTPPFVIVHKPTNSNQTSLNNAKYSVQPNATQPQKIPNPDSVLLMAQQISTSQPTSSFTVHANLFFQTSQHRDFPQQQEVQCQILTHLGWLRKVFQEHQISLLEKTIVSQVVAVTSGGGTRVYKKVLFYKKIYFQRSVFFVSR